MPASDVADGQQVHSGRRRNLRLTLLDAAMALVDEGGAAQFSLREVARRAGVSPAASYRHYEDKKALLTAVAQVGLARLEDSLRQALAGDVSQGDLAGRLVNAYVAFAVERPGLFVVMFGAGGFSGSEMDLARVLAMFDSARAPGPDASSPGGDRGVELWAYAHGVAALTIGGRLEASGWC